MYSSNRYDCLQYILDYLNLEINRQKLPDKWFHQHNSLVKDAAALVSNPKGKLQIRAVVLRMEKLKPGDIVFMRFQGKFAHHLARFIGHGHIEHCMPLRGVCKQLLSKKTFLFGVRLWGSKQ